MLLLYAEATAVPMCRSQDSLWSALIFVI